MKFIKSHYKSRWIGIVLDTKSRGNANNLLLILIVRNSLGNIPRKRILIVLDESWVTKIKEIDISNINPDWFINIPNIYKIN